MPIAPISPIRPTTARPDAAGPVLGSAEVPTLSIVIPTFNEAGNIDELLARLGAAIPAGLAAEVIFVDDSTDRTPDVIRAAVTRSAASGLPVRLIHRSTPTGGLSGAVVEGLRVARAPYAVVMDGDLQHPPAAVPALLAKAAATGADAVVATRYTEGGNGAGLGSTYRHVVSRGSKALAAAVFGGPVARMSDPLSGFFAVRVAALDLDAVDPIGYKILLELVVRSNLRTIAEVPFEFGARHSGESKSTLREGMRFLRHLAVLRAGTGRTARRRPAHPAPAARPA